MRSIRRDLKSLEARIEVAERLTASPAISDEALRAYEHAARVIACFVCEWPKPAPEAILRCLLQSGLPEEDARRYASMPYSQARDELMEAAGRLEGAYAKG